MIQYNWKCCICFENDLKFCYILDWWTSAFITEHYTLVCIHNTYNNVCIHEYAYICWVLCIENCNKRISWHELYHVIIPSLRNYIRRSQFSKDVALSSSSSLVPCGNSNQLSIKSEFVWNPGIMALQILFVYKFSCPGSGKTMWDIPSIQIHRMCAWSKWTNVGR